MGGVRIGYDFFMKSKRRYVFPAIATIAVLIFSFLPQSATANPNANSSAAAFWTADKIKNAKAFDMVFEAGSKEGKRVTVAKGANSIIVGASNKTLTGSVLGAPWEAGGLPLMASGKVFFRIGTSNYQCSGSLAQEGNSSLSIVLTAGHCLYDNKTQRYVTNFIFIPSYDINLVTISGCTGSNKCWSAMGLEAHPDFMSQTSFTYQATWFDWGFATIKELKNNLLPDANGNSFPLVTTTQLDRHTAVNAFGYPAGKPYNGKDLIYSFGLIGFDSNNENKTYSLASNMTGGASGGPWLSGTLSATLYSGNLSSVNSYKYLSDKNHMYGPKFGSATNNTYQLALAK